MPEIAEVQEIKDDYPTRREKEKIFDRCDPVVYEGFQGEIKHGLNKEALGSYEENGFMLFPSLFSKEEVAVFLEAFKDLIQSESLQTRDEYVTEPESGALRTIFSPHRFSAVFDRLSRDRRILDKVRQILGGDVYIHHSRINIKRGLEGKSFPWHSDFETWHAEDGFPRPRCLSACIMLTENTEFNGPLYLIRGSHKRFVSCAGQTPQNHFKESLKKQAYGSPSRAAIARLVDEGDLVGVYGPPGTLVLTEGNIMHGSPDNISPRARTNTFFVFNSVHNLPAPKPFGAGRFRPPFLSNRDYSPLEAVASERI